MVLGECGRLPLCYTYFTTCIKYWCKLLTLSDHRYPKRCYMLLTRLDEAGRINRATIVKNMLFMYGFGYVWVAQEVGNIDLFLWQFHQRLKQCLSQDWYSSVNSSSRCHYYIYFKSLLETDRYLSLDLLSKQLYSLSTFRCASHPLHVEVGRHTGVEQCQKNMFTLSSI